MSADGSTPSFQLVVVPVLSSTDTETFESAVHGSLAGLALDDLIGVIGKTAGSGGADDDQRSATEEMIVATLATAFDVSTETIGSRVPIMLSGGCYGPATPHVSLIFRTEGSSTESGSRGRRLAASAAFSEEIHPEEIGRMGHVAKTADAVRSALRACQGYADFEAKMVFVKGPTLTLTQLRGLESVPAVVDVDGPFPELEAMCYSNDGSALGVAVALGEVSMDDLADDLIREDWSLYSNRAMTSSAGEKARAEVVVLGNAGGLGGDLAIGSSTIRSLIDIEGVRRAIRDGYLAAAPSTRESETRSEEGEVVQVFMKVLTPDDGLVDGQVTTMRGPSAGSVVKATGAVLAALSSGVLTNYVSGGELNSHQGAPGESPVAAVVRVDGGAAAAARGD